MTHDSSGWRTAGDPGDLIPVALRGYGLVIGYRDALPDPTHDVWGLHGWAEVGGGLEAEFWGRKVRTVEAGGVRRDPSPSFHSGSG
jgi:hypothetical protein